MKKCLVFCLSLISVIPASVKAFETDQFSNRDEHIADATSLMNRRVNLAIAGSIIGYHGKRDEMKVVNRVYYKIGGKHWVMQRPFDWADHINDYWDEALNINHYDALLYPYMEARLLELCDYYRTDPGLFDVHDEQALKQRYQNLQLRETSELRLNNLCNTEHHDAIETMTGTQ